MTTIYERGIKKIALWLQKRNWEVWFGSFEDEMLNWSRTIKINNRFSKEKQLYGLLHECGHVLVQSDKKYSRKYPFIAKVDYLPSKRKKALQSKKYKVELISEEIEAWKKGKQLAKRLNISINSKKYHEETVKWVYSHIKALSENGNHSK